MGKRRPARPSPLRLVAALLLYWDGDGDGDVDASDLMDWDGDGTIDALGSLSLLVKLLVVAFAAQQLLRRSASPRRVYEGFSTGRALRRRWASGSTTARARPRGPRTSPCSSAATR